jgi:hypothetical protein
MLFYNQPVSNANHWKKLRFSCLFRSPQGCATRRVAMSPNQHQPPRPARYQLVSHQQPTVPGVRVVDLADNSS